MHKGPPNNQNFYNSYILYHCHGIQSHSYRLSRFQMALSLKVIVLVRVGTARVGKSSGGNVRWKISGWELFGHHHSHIHLVKFNRGQRVVPYLSIRFPNPRIVMHNAIYF